MDRGIKIAILAACVLSLGFGLIWDKFLDGARALVPERTGSMDPDRVSVRVGASDIPGPVKPLPSPTNNGHAPGEEPQDPEKAGEDSVGPVEQVDPDAPSHVRDWLANGIIKDGKYRAQKGDGLWKIAHDPGRFKHLKKESADWLRANPQLKNDPAKIREGDWLTIPS